MVLLSVAIIAGNAWSQALPPIDELQSQADGQAEADPNSEPVEFVDVAAAKAFGEPPQAKRLSPKSNLWIDLERKRVYVDGYVALVRGQLEMFACPTGSKEHESVLGLLAQSREVHAALLSIGAKTGTAVRYQPEFIPPTGQPIRIWVCWRDENAQFQVADARSLIRNVETKETLKEDWVFAGSSFWKDPEDGREYYQADGGDMICVSNFSTAMLDVPFASSADAGGLLFEPFAEHLPPRDTPVRLMMVPIPISSDKPLPAPPTDPNAKPNDIILPAPKTSSERTSAP